MGRSFLRITCREFEVGVSDVVSRCDVVVVVFFPYVLFLWSVVLLLIWSVVLLNFGFGTNGCIFVTPRRNRRFGPVFIDSFD
jgi:hypothetical protein